ncbi:MAG: alpha-mannosidase [Oscillatoriales cyanobacterium]|nr:MAG: alpha-mannosidase [Oscillatoriales cyanobacterium]
MTFSSCLQTIEQCCDRLRQLSHHDIIDRWGIRFDETTTPPPVGLMTTAPPVELDDRRYALWSRGRVPVWFTTQIVIPETLQGYAIAGKTLRLALRWWAEDAQIFVNGERVLAGDLYDCFGRVVLMPNATPGTAIDLAMRLVSPGHDAGALVTSVLQYESEYAAGCFDPAFVAEEIAVVAARLCPTPQATPSATADATTPTAELGANTSDRLHHLASLLAPLQSRLSTLDSTVTDSPTCRHPGDDRDVQTLNATIDPLLTDLRDRLARDFPRDALAIHLLTHAHLDMAWLWPIAETYDAAQRTFESVLNLQNDYPETIYTHSSPALYAWIEHHRPDLFTQIQTQVKRDRWDVAAGLWVEPDLNLIAGESIVRQILYGQRYCEAKFGQVSRVAWLPDSFGFCWQLPQLFAQGGIDYFVTQKLRWNDTTEFPYELFYWRSPDGTEIPAWMAAPIGTDINPVEMTRYAAQWQANTDRDTALWLPGAGDHGGGPTRDMLDRVRRWQSSPVFPTMEFQSSADFLDTVTRPTQEAATLPVWSSELYLELHRGCYTTYASQKRANRTCEILLYQAELYATIAAIHTGSDYPKSDLEASWKRVLLNQFHDILPGSAIPEVFAEADREWTIASATAQSIRDTALQAIAAQLTVDPAVLASLTSQGWEPVPLIVFNPVLGQRSERIALDLAAFAPDRIPWNPGQRYQIFDDCGTPIESQQDDTVLLFAAIDLPSLGAQRYWITAIAPQAEAPAAIAPSAQAWTLQNEFLVVEIDPTTGDIARCFDRIQQREVLAPSGGNRLEAYIDQGQYWDAWNIDPEYEQHPIDPPVLESMQWLQGGSTGGQPDALRSRLRVIRRLRESRWIQDYILDRGSPLLEIATIVDWRERHVVVKTAFDFAFSADHAVYETPCGAIDRPIRPQTPADQAQWEVPMLQWCDLSQGDHHDPDSVYGVSLLNDCKYGGDATPDRLRLTLLRGSTWPDPSADLGEHRFRYALYPHAGPWQTAGTVRQAIAFNQPPIVLCPTPAPPSTSEPKTASSLGLNCDWLQLGSDPLVLMALKQSEEGDRWLLRCYESAGETAAFEITGALGFSPAGTLDLLERPQAALIDRVTPWRVVSVALTPPMLTEPSNHSLNSSSNG